jgi:hypothetical protein
MWGAMHPPREAQVSRRARRNIRPRGRNQPLGMCLAALAVCLQLVFAGWHPPVPRASGGGADLAALLDEHALCRAGGAAAPRDDAPTPPRDHDLAACCRWHAAPGLQPPAPAAAAQPVVFAVAAVIGIAGDEALGPAPRPGAVGARAPPPVETLPT